MKIEKQITPVKQSKILSELGFNLKTQWYHVKIRALSNWIVVTEEHIQSAKSLDYDIEYYPAPTIAELIFILPWAIKLKEGIYEFRFEKTELYFNVCYWLDKFKRNKLLVSINGDLNEALSETLIFLIKNGHLKAENLKL